MQLQELLEHVSAGVLQDRAAPASGPSKTLWADSVLVNYFNQAEQMFARRTYCLIDSTTTAVTTVDLVASQSAYSLHAAVLRVLSARISDTVLDLPRLEHKQLQAIVGATTTPGRPIAWGTDDGTRKLWTYPAPNTAEAVNNLLLRVARLPITPLSLTALTAEPEIPAEYHLDLCDWVAYKALTHRDVDGEASKDAKDFRAAFMQSIKDARYDMKRLMDNDVGYSFGGWANG